MLKTTIATALLTVTALFAGPTKVFSNNATTCPPVQIFNVTVTPMCGFGNISMVAYTSTNDGKLKYTWVDSTNIEFGNGTNRIVTSASGTYTCTVTNSCGSTITTTATFVSNPLFANPSIVNDNTYGGNEGSICANPYGGTPPYTYSWNADSVRPCLANLTAGLYAVTITDAAGCTTIYQDIPVNQPAPDTLYFTDSTAAYGHLNPLAVLTANQISNCGFDYNTVDSVAIKSYQLLPADTVAITWQVFNGNTATTIIAKYFILNPKSGIYDFELLLYCGSAAAKERLAVSHGYIKAKEKYYINTSALGIAPINAPTLSYVYPVPCSSQLTVHVGTAGKYLLTILDVSGKITGTFTMSESEVDHYINLNSMDKGLYFLKLQSLTTGEIELHKIIKD